MRHQMRVRNRLLRFEKRGGEQPGGGRPDWETHVTIWAGIRRHASIRDEQETMAAGAERGMSVVHLMVDSTTQTRAITTAMRAVDTMSGAVFNVNTIQDINGLGRELVIVATEEAPT